MIAVSAPNIPATAPEALPQFSHSQSKRSLAKALEPIHALAAQSASLKVLSDRPADATDVGIDLPRFLYMGPDGGGEAINVGIFAGIHGDEPEGVHALVRFVALLEGEPEIAQGFCLFLYPVCNPSGFAERTRHSRSKKDLNREFWRGSTEPEVRMLESELRCRNFQGLISLHTDDSATGFYGFAQGATLTKDLIEPALAAAEQFLPVDKSEHIDGFPARNGIIKGGYSGMLSAPPGIRPKPFEIVLETPHAAPAYLKEAALVAALRTILIRYRQFIAYAPNI